MRAEEIRIGETYRVREWDDLAAEFGVDRMPNGLLLVNTPVPLPNTHRWICGSPFTVKRTEKLGRNRGGNILCLSEEKTEVLEEDAGGTRIIVVTPEMLEEIPLPEIPPESLLDFLLK